MLLGPIFQVDLVTSVRRARFYIVRGIYGLLLLLVLWVTYVSTLHAARAGSLTIHEMAALATGYFQSFAWIQLLAVLLAGPAIVAGTIATERERRTIEYLFATDLSNFELVVGKLAARLLHIGFLVLVGLPILSLFRLMGGISTALMLAVFLLTLSSMVFVATISVCISVWSTRARDAVVHTYLILAAFLLVPLCVYLMFMVAGLPMTWWSMIVQSVNDALLAINPLWMLSALFWGGGPAGAVIPWQPLFTLVGGQAIVSAACALLATAAVRRVHLRAAGGTANGRWRWKRRLLSRLPRPAIANRPMLWKELFAGHASVRLGAVGWVAAALLVAAVLGFTAWAFLSGNSSIPMRVTPINAYAQKTVMIASLVACGGLLLIGAQAAGAITGEKERNCWTSLLSTDLRPREVILAKIAGNVYASRWLWVLLAITWGLGVILDPGFLGIVVAQFLVLSVLSLFSASLGVLYSLHCSSTPRAMGATLATMLFIGGGYLFVCMPFMAGPSNGVEIVFAPCAPFLLIAPTLFYVEPQILHHEPALGVAFMIGCAGYLLASLALVSSAITGFDRASGRIHWQWGSVPQVRLRETPPQGAAGIDDESVIVAEAVDEMSSGTQ